MKSKGLIEATILFAGDSGDGMQLTGSQFTQTAALFGNDVNTLPDFPSEIRAPLGTTAGVSGFQVHFGSIEINSPGDACDVLVCMNAAALKKSLDKIKPKGIIIANTAGFDAKNLRLAQYNHNPLESLKSDFEVFEIDISKQTLEALRDFKMSQKEKDRTKNMFALGFVYWLFSKDLENTKTFLNKKFFNKQVILQSNLNVLQAGYQYGEIAEIFTERYTVEKARMDAGLYRNITGNEALVLGVLAAATKAQLPIYYAGYPITPASDILHYFSKYKRIGVKTFQAEDEIAAITSLVGASFGGHLAITASSGPGIALKTEGIGLGFMLELPMIIVNVQRGGPSTGLPTKTEQSDLMQAIYGRNGEAPLPVFAAKSPVDCFYTAYEACQTALEFSTPVILLSDGYIANGSEPWKVPDFKKLPSIEHQFISESDDEAYLPYKRNHNLARKIALPGVKGKEHVIGGLEKQEETGNVSYDAENHQKMVHLRSEKVKLTAKLHHKSVLDQGEIGAKYLILSWGSTYGSIRDAMKVLLNNGVSIAHCHIRNINPLPKDLGEMISGSQKVIIPEINDGQLIRIIQDRYTVQAIAFQKIKGTPFMSSEIIDFINNL